MTDEEKRYWHAYCSKCHAVREIDVHTTRCVICNKKNALGS